MKKFQVYFVVILLLYLLLPLGSLEKAQAAPISLSSKAFTLEVNHYKTLYIRGTIRKVTWSSSNTKIAKVTKGGRVTAISPGTATIYAAVAGKKLTCKVTVVKLSSKKVTLIAGKAKTLKVNGTSSKVSWYSSNKAIATVSSDGKVKAKAPGEVTIYAKVSGKKLSCKVTVVKLNTTSVTLTQGKYKTLKVYGTSSKVTWSSSNKAIATVTTTGRVTAKKPGTVRIYASVSGVKLTSVITVKKAASTNTPTPTPLPDNNKPSQEPQEPMETETTKRMIGYYAAWSSYSEYTPDLIAADKLTHINYAFANIGEDLKIELGYPDIDPSNISKLNQLKLKHPNLKTLISVGGWSWSKRFSDVALTRESRTAFADSVVAFLVEYGFDGVDIDWEYPVSGGLSTNIRRPEDKRNFTLLMKTLREKLDARGKEDKKSYLLTFAGAAGSWYTKNVELDQLRNYVDYANIMTYDIHGTWDSYTNFNAPLYKQDSLSSNSISVDSSIEDWLEAGFPKEKLSMGVPFYGYIYHMVQDKNNGLNQTYSGGASISYHNIAKKYLNSEDYTRYYHADSRVPWLFNGSTFISYEDEESMKEKARYIHREGLGGAMIWELSQDPDQILLNSLYQELIK